MTPEGLDPVKVLMSRELLETLFTRDAAGHRLHVQWREPDAEGYLTPWISVDYTDHAPPCPEHSKVLMP